MLVLFLFAFIYYRIAEQFNKNRWLWAAVGGLGYAAIQFALSILYALLIELGFITIKNSTLVTVILIGISGGIMYFIYTRLRRKWESEDDTFSGDSINEIGSQQNDSL